MDPSDTPVLVSLLMMLGVLLFLIALANIVYPIKALRIRTRGRALLVLLTSVVVLTVAGAMLPSPAGETATVEPAPAVDENPAKPAEADALDAPKATVEYSAPEMIVALLTSEASAAPAGPTPEADGITVATWEYRLTQSVTESVALIYRAGAMVLESKYSDGTSDGTSTRGVVERPADRPTERRFDLQPEYERSEYITLSASGQVRYFGWEGRQFDATTATFVHPDALVIGANPVERECVPKVLSETTYRVIALYRELHTFKDDPAFTVFGFARGGPYHAWLQTAHDLEDMVGLEVMDELGFSAAHVMDLGLQYMYEATLGTDYKKLIRIRNIEQLIRADWARATCGEALGVEP